MGIKGKFEVEVDIKSSGDLFHELLGSTPHHLPNISPTNLHTCDLHEGDFGKPGTVTIWSYTLDGKKSVVKVLVEAIDNENKMIRYKLIEGELLNEYKSLGITVQVIPMVEITGVKLTVEFEKKNDEGPFPTNIIDLIIAVTKDIETHHLNA